MIRRGAELLPTGEVDLVVMPDDHLVTAEGRRESDQPLQNDEARGDDATCADAAVADAVPNAGSDPAASWGEARSLSCPPPGRSAFSAAPWSIEFGTGEDEIWVLDSHGNIVAEVPRDHSDADTVVRAIAALPELLAAAADAAKALRWCLHRFEGTPEGFFRTAERLEGLLAGVEGR